MKHIDIKDKLGKKGAMCQAICLLVKANCLKAMKRDNFHEYYCFCLHHAGEEGFLIFFPELLF
jgi:hypothetical protein